MHSIVADMLSAARLDLEFAVRFVGSVPTEQKGVHMELIEGTDYTRAGWREGEEATLANRPRFTLNLDAWNASPDKRAWNTSFRLVADDAAVAYEDALSPELKAERAAESERKMMAEATEFYRNRQPGDYRSFWD